MASASDRLISFEKREQKRQEQKKRVKLAQYVLTCPFTKNSDFNWNWENKMNWSLKAHVLRAVEFFRSDPLAKIDAKTSKKVIPWKMILDRMFAQNMSRKYLDKKNKIKSNKIKSMKAAINKWNPRTVAMQYVLNPKGKRSCGAGKNDDIPIDVANKVYKLIHAYSSDSKTDIYFNTIWNLLIETTKQYGGYKVFTDSKEKKQYEKLQKKKEKN
eukprot:311741_1